MNENHSPADKIAKSKETLRQMRDYVYDREVHEWRTKAEALTQRIISRTREWNINDPKLERLFMRYRRVMNAIIDRIEQHPRYP